MNLHGEVYSKRIEFAWWVLIIFLNHCFRSFLSITNTASDDIIFIRKSRIEYDNASYNYKFNHIATWSICVDIATEGLLIAVKQKHVGIVCNIRDLRPPGSNSRRAFCGCLGKEREGTNYEGKKNYLVNTNVHISNHLNLHQRFLHLFFLEMLITFSCRINCLVMKTFISRNFSHCKSFLPKLLIPKIQTVNSTIIRNKLSWFPAFFPFNFWL